jgi:hypothetical protein
MRFLRDFSLSCLGRRLELNCWEVAAVEEMMRLESRNEEGHLVEALGQPKSFGFMTRQVIKVRLTPIDVIP